MKNDETHIKKYNILFVHNSVPEYRIKFWSELGKRVNLDLFITQKNLDQKIYGLKKVTYELNIKYMSTKAILKKLVRNYDCIILPPADTVYEYMVGQQLIYYCRKYRVPYIYWTEKWEALAKYQPFLKKLKNRCQRVFIKSLCKHASLCVASGSKAKEYYQNIGIKAQRIRVVVDSSTSVTPAVKYDIRKKYGLSPDSRIILFFGRVVERKGCKYLLEASMPILKNNNIYLFICGTGESLDDCKKLAAVSGCKNIFFTGKIQPDERKNYYMGADLLVLPSFSQNGVCEAWGLTVNEALECGIPVVVTTAVGAGYDLIDENNGLMVDEQDVQKLKEAMDFILKHKEKYDRNTIQLNYQKYSVLNMAENFYQVILEAIQ